MRRCVTTLTWLGLGALCALAQSPAQAPTTAPQAHSAIAPLTLADAIQLARANSPEFQQALMAQGLAHEDTKQATAALLPNASFSTAYIYNEGGRYIAYNGEHEYTSLGNIHEDISTGGEHLAERQKALAAEAYARAQTELASRGLTATVTTDFYTLVAAQRKVTTAQRARDEAERYLGISQHRESGGEVAHADVIKAQLELQDKDRELSEANLEQTRARLDLAVLIYADFNQSYALADDLDQVPNLPTHDQVLAMAEQKNPALAAAQAQLKQAQEGVSIARSGLLPTLSLDYFYGIDASHYATYTGDMRNLGSAAQASLNVPLWNWGATKSKITQADLQRRQAQLVMRYTQRELLASLESAYAEATAARSELAALASSSALAAESLRLIGLNYEAGEATILELVDAQNLLTDANNRFSDGQVRYRVALANLQVVTGAF